MKKAKEFILKMETASAVRECCSPSSPNALPSPLVYSASANCKLVDNRGGWLSSDELLSDSLGQQHKQVARPTLAANSKPETPPHAPPCAVNPLTQKHGPIHADYPTVDQFVSDDGRTYTSQSELKQTYRSTFKSDWSLKWPYILRSPSGDPYVFFCSICKKTLSCAHQGIRDVTRHLESSGHLDKMNLSTKINPEHQDILSGNRSLQALRDSGELSVVKTPPLDDDSDQDGDNDNSPPPTAHALQASQALAAVDGRLNPALKDVQCPICYKVFSRKFSLEMHFLIHQGLKPYTCEHCGRSFRQKGTLMRHTAIHNQTPSYRCGLCDRSYRQKNVFLHHLRNRHKISTDMLDRRRSKGGTQDETGSSHSFLESMSPSGATETVYPPPESPGSPALSEHQDTMPVRPLSAEPVTSTLPNHPSPFPTPNPVSVPMPMPLSGGPFPNSPLFLPNFLPFPTMGFPAAQTGRAVSPQNSWRCFFCPFETLSEDTEDWRKHLLHHLSDTPHSCLSCGHRCANESELFAHIQDCHAAGRGALNISSVLQAAVNKLSHTLLVLCAFQLSG